MGFFSDMANFFLGRHDDSDEWPTDEDREAAQATDQLMGSDYEEDWNSGVDMGTVPDTPTEYEGEDTDPEHPAIGWGRLLPWNW